ncbi:MAG: ankyrin repeat domain-containing protein [Candidatus Sulfopaludibacter sp.]|nr:ankyrin repeat domain-containing protein [Candidatus Sulfopaludibacter sp.]
MRLAILLAAGASLLWASDTRVIDAIKRRDHKAVKALVSGHADINAAEPDGATPLAWATYLDDTETAKLLLASGAKVKTADEYGETPLTLACANGNAALVTTYINAGLDVNAARWDGESALMIAANTGNPEVVKELIAHGAKVDAADSRKGQTALMWAAAEGHSDVVDLLIQSGATVNAASKSGFNALVFAAVKNDPKSVHSLLAAGADANYGLPDGTKVLLVATSHKSILAAGALVDGGADPNVADRTGNTPLHTAAQLGSAELIEKLLAKGANVDARTAKSNFGGRGGGGGGFRFAPAGEQTALMMAAKANEPDAMKALVKGGADPKLKAQDGSTLLMFAAGSGHVEAVKYAYELDQDTKALNDQKSTVMHAAVTGTGSVPQPEICKVVEFLASKGAPLNEKDARGRTPFDICDPLPLDQVQDVLTRLIVAAGGVPPKSKRQ